MIIKVNGLSSLNIQWVVIYIVTGIHLANMFHADSVSSHW